MDSYDDDSGPSSVLSGGFGDSGEVQNAIDDIYQLLGIKQEPNEDDLAVTDQEEDKSLDYGSWQLSQRVPDLSWSQNQDEDISVKSEMDLNFDECFSELFPDLSVADQGI